MLTKFARSQFPSGPASGGATRRGWRATAGGKAGISTVFFAVSATALLTMGALATEVGVWYMSLRTSRNAADAGAMAAATVHARIGETPALRAGAQVAEANGYAHGSNGTTVTVTRLNDGTYANTTGIYEVVITRSQFAALTRLVTNITPTVRVRAVAGTLNEGDACVLALGVSNGSITSTGLDLSGNATLDAPTCVFASNKPGSDSIEVIGGASDINLLSLQAAGGCSNCGNSNVTLTSPYRTNSPPVRDPYASLQGFNQPTSRTGSGSNQQIACFNDANTGDFFTTGSGRHAVTTNPRTVTPTTRVSGRDLPTAFCGGPSDSTTATWNVNNNESLVFTPGVYYFFNSSLAVNGTGSVTCPTCTATNGVTLVFTGASGERVGTMTVNGSATFQLSAGSTQVNPLDTSESYAGVLVYRDDLATCNGTGSGCGGSWSRTDINGNERSFFNGAVYMPTTDIQFTGNATVGSTTCNVIIGNSVSFGGNVGYEGCSAIGTNLLRLSAIRLLE